ncbi:hypothetical protein SAY86_007677 [Trapa natans]|uniref:Uncharacterized protein n=1 Tax=Trapa natans TaxID=22666 RepID=A0AAN7R2D9_TRANT|nr:hypothetical protein SAY86_007677 [Trapa natans]
MPIDFINGAVVEDSFPGFSCRAGRIHGGILADCVGSGGHGLGAGVGDDARSCYLNPSYSGGVNLILPAAVGDRTSQSLLDTRPPVDR